MGYITLGEILEQVWTDRVKYTAGYKKSIAEREDFPSLPIINAAKTFCVQNKEDLRYVFALTIRQHPFYFELNRPVTQKEVAELLREQVYPLVESIEIQPYCPRPFVSLCRFCIFFVHLWFMDRHHRQLMKVLSRNDPESMSASILIGCKMEWTKSLMKDRRERMDLYWERLWQLAQDQGLCVTTENSSEMKKYIEKLTSNGPILSKVGKIRQILQDFNLLQALDLHPYVAQRFPGELNVFLLYLDGLRADKDFSGHETHMFHTFCRHALCIFLYTERSIAFKIEDGFKRSTGVGWWYESLYQISAFSWLQYLGLCQLLKGFSKEILIDSRKRRPAPSPPNSHKRRVISTVNSSISPKNHTKSTTDTVNEQEKSILNRDISQLLTECRDKLPVLIEENRRAEKSDTSQRATSTTEKKGTTLGDILETTWSTVAQSESESSNGGEITMDRNVMLLLRLSSISESLFPKLREWKAAHGCDNPDKDDATPEQITLWLKDKYEAEFGSSLSKPGTELELCRLACQIRLLKLENALYSMTGEIFEKLRRPVEFLYLRMVEWDLRQDESFQKFAKYYLYHAMHLDATSDLFDTSWTSMLEFKKAIQVCCPTDRIQHIYDVLKLDLSESTTMDISVRISPCLGHQMDLSGLTMLERIEMIDQYPNMLIRSSDVTELAHGYLRLQKEMMAKQE